MDIRDNKISIILPTYKEAETIEMLIISIMEVVKPFEIIVVDDDSPDGTWKVVEELRKKYPNLVLLRRIEEKGVATAIREGCNRAKGDVILWMDADFSMHPGYISAITDKIGEYDVVVGSRYVNGGKDSRSLDRIITSRLLNGFASLVLSRSIRDYTSGLVAVKREVFDEIEIIGGHGEYCIGFLYEATKKFKVIEVPYTFTERLFGVSKTFPSIFSIIKQARVYGFAVLRARFSNRRTIK